MNLKFQKSANALLVSVILGSVLLILAVTLNQVVLRQLKSQYEIKEAIQAYYSAKAGIEKAFLNTKNSLPGYEALESIDLNSDLNIDYAFNISAKSSVLPCEQDSKDGWYALSVQESFRTPLFVGNEKNEQIDVTDFVVEFYVDRKVDEEQFMPTSGDVIKWSVIGMKNTAAGNISESIQDYVPMQTGKISAETPSSFGTFGDAYTTAKYYQPKSYPINESTQYVFHNNYSIKTFLIEHESNYLVLENIIDLGLQSGFCDDPECNKIKFRVKGLEQEFACSTVLVQADGFGDKVKQSLDAKYKPGDFLPVFDFALFQYNEDQ
ncbi:hypothetical protein A2229_01965 [Candidatus Peregrinibacteria bacterium RIFOXYA2_FULL_33_7]|nr:MAG: hypothetical protein A2229_01965 [Candidatus Peregrinibacteria bacterium RIFOXYA2_FULL_33_7]